MKMNEIIRYENVENKIMEIRGEQVIIDRDVAELYGVETREINQAVKNNKDKFPDGYIFTLDKSEIAEVIKNFDNLGSIKYNPVPPTVFTEKRLVHARHDS
jgi:Zn-dependent oligopeptidase